MTRRNCYKILQIIPARPDQKAVYVHGSKVTISPVVCWAVVEEEGHEQRRVMGMDASKGSKPAIDFCELTEGFSHYQPTEETRYLKDQQ
jgi:hypothetical protein